MRQYEIELFFPENPDTGEEAYMTVTPVECNTGTELEYRANYEYKKQGAIAVSFGPRIPRNENGEPK